AAVAFRAEPRQRRAGHGRDRARRLDRAPAWPHPRLAGSARRDRRRPLPHRRRQPRQLRQLGGRRGHAAHPVRGVLQPHRVHRVVQQDGRARVRADPKPRPAGARHQGLRMSAGDILDDLLSVAGPVFANTAPTPALADNEGVTLRGADPVFPTPPRVGELGAAAIAAAALAAARLHAQRTGVRQRVSVDVDAAAAAMRSWTYLADTALAGTGPAGTGPAGTGPISTGPGTGAAQRRPAGAG